MFVELKIYKSKNNFFCNFTASLTFLSLKVLLVSIFFFTYGSHFMRGLKFPNKLNFDKGNLAEIVSFLLLNSLLQSFNWNNLLYFVVIFNSNTKITNNEITKVFFKFHQNMKRAIVIKIFEVIRNSEFSAEISDDCEDFI